MNSKKHIQFISAALVISIFLSVVLLLPFAKVNADAAVSIYISGTAEVGKTINASLSISGPEAAYAGFSGGFVYNSSLLRLDAISSNYSLQAKSETMGTFSSVGGLSIPSGSTIITGTFTCLAEGSTTISLSEFEVDAKYSGASAALTITTPVPKSDNRNLASLKVSPGSLSPSFSWSTTSYSMSVGEDVTKVSVTAVAEDSKAKVSLNGVQNNIKPGVNTIKITVTAENGNTKVYSITVTRASGPTGTPTPTPQPLPLVTYLEDELMIIPIDENTTVPEGFTATTSTYKGIEIPVFKGPASAGSTDEILLVQLLTEQKVKLFVYDPTGQIVYPLLFIAQEETSLRLLDAGDAIQAPKGYEKFVFEYDGEPVNAYRLISDPDHPQILLYMMDAEGKEVFYYYDTEKEMLMPYRGETVLVDPTVTPTPSPDPSASTTEALVTDDTVPSDSQPMETERKTLLENLSDFKSPFTIMFYLVALIALVLAAAVVSLMIGRRSDYEEDYDDDYLPEDEPVPPLAVYPAGTVNRVPDPDDVFEENYGTKKNQSETSYIPSIVRTATSEKPVNQSLQSNAGVKEPSRPVADAVSVMGVRRVQLDSIPELAEPAKAVAPTIPPIGAVAPIKPVTQTASPINPAVQQVPKPQFEPQTISETKAPAAPQPSVEPNNNPKVQNPIPEYIPVRLKLELDEAINKASAAEQVKVPAESPAKTTANTAPQASPVKASDADFGLRYVPGDIKKEPAMPAKEGPVLDFPDIRKNTSGSQGKENVTTTTENDPDL